jgi:midasin (ATPase involved in ribosome maturation)
MATANNKISMNSEELKSLLTYIHNNNKILLEKNLPVQTVNVEGEAGGGKTSTILQLANELGLDMIRKNLAELEDVSDYKK